jgi:hypothetical protein
MMPSSQKAERTASEQLSQDRIHPESRAESSNTGILPWATATTTRTTRSQDQEQLDQRCDERDAKHASDPLRHVRTGEVRCEEFLYELKAGQRAASGRPRPAASRLLPAPEPSHASKKANRSALMVSACVVGMPCGKPL